MSQIVRWGVLSTARINDEVIPAIRAVAEAELCAVASRDLDRAQAYAQQREIPAAYGSYEDLLADPGIDAVYISLPNSFHGEWVEAALAAGKHVLCEKPLTPTAAEAERLFRLAADRGLVLMEAFMYRHHPKVKVVRSLIEDGRIGEVQVIRSWFHFKTENRDEDIRYEPSLAGGALRDVGSYCVSLSTYLMGREPDWVGGHARIASSGVDEAFAGVLGFDPDTVAVFDCGMFSPLDVGVRVLGTDGRLVVRMPWYAHLEPLEVELHTGADVTTVPAPGGNAYALEIANVCAAISGESNPEIPPAETLRNLRVLEMLGVDAQLPVTA